MRKYILIFKDNFHNKIDIEEFDDFKLALKKYRTWNRILSKFSHIKVFLVCKIDY